MRKKYLIYAIKKVAGTELLKLLDELVSKKKLSVDNLEGLRNFVASKYDQELPNISKFLNKLKNSHHEMKSADVSFIPDRGFKVNKTKINHWTRFKNRAANAKDYIFNGVPGDVRATLEREKQKASIEASALKTKNKKLQDNVNGLNKEMLKEDASRPTNWPLIAGIGGMGAGGGYVGSKFLGKKDKPEKPIQQVPTEYYNA